MLLARLCGEPTQSVEERACNVSRETGEPFSITITISDRHIGLLMQSDIATYLPSLSLPVIATWWHLSLTAMLVNHPLGC